MATAEPGSWLAIGRFGGAIATVLVLLIVGVGAGHLALSSMQVLLGGFAVGPGNEDVRDGAHAFRDRDRFERHAARGWEWRHAARNDADLGLAFADDARRRGFAARRACRDRRACVKAADAGAPKTYE